MSDEWTEQDKAEMQRLWDALRTAGPPEIFAIGEQYEALRFKRDGRSYQVTWTIDFDAHSPEEAARLAHAAMSDGSQDAPVFTVRAEDGTETDVDMRDVYREAG